MKLLIELKKKREKSVLICTREDESATYATLHPGLAIHDIAHYVVETQLGFSNAFYGLLAAGWAIADFQLPKDQRPVELHPKNLHWQALLTEHLVNLLQTDYLQNNSTMDIISQLRAILADDGLPFPGNLSSEKVHAMVKDLRDIMNDWMQLEEDESLQLYFEAAE